VARGGGERLRKRRRNKEQKRARGDEGICLSGAWSSGQAFTDS